MASQPAAAHTWHAGLHLHYGFGAAVSTLFAEIWDTRGYDKHLRRVLSDSLNVLHATGIVVYVADREATIHYFLNMDGGVDEQVLLKKIRDEVEDQVRQGDGQCWKTPLKFRINERLRVAIVAIPDQRRALLPAGESGEGSIWCGNDPLALNFCALIYDLKGRWWDRKNKKSGNKHPSDQEETFFVGAQSQSSMRLLFDVIRGRVRRFAPFAPKVSQRYWEDAKYALLEDVSPAQRDTLRPPWELDDPVPTATLSFDLRKSTFCMEHADDPFKFADWLDELVQILTAVAHRNGGTFDKFTGDGAIVHFLQNECHVIYHRRATDAALACAADMQQAMVFHLSRLRPNLRMDSRLLGAGIGIDYGNAFWRIDHRDNPIVVGRGVVGACRHGAADAGTVVVTNIAYQKLDRHNQNRLEQFDVTTKEMKEEMKITAWRIVHPRGILGAAPTEEIYGICKRVWDGSERKKRCDGVNTQSGTCGKTNCARTPTGRTPPSNDNRHWPV